MSKHEDDNNNNDEDDSRKAMKQHSMLTHESQEQKGERARS